MQEIQEQSWTKGAPLGHALVTNQMTILRLIVASSCRDTVAPSDIVIKTNVLLSSSSSSPSLSSSLFLLFV